ncbi:MAG: hypothetical protein AB8B80_04655 [Marinicellaceae bacterium]
MLIIIPPILFSTYWYYSICLGIMLVPIWIKVRFNVYQKEIENIKNHKLTLDKNTLTFHYTNSKYSINLTNLTHLNVNTKKGCIDSIRLLLSDNNSLLITQYEKIENILKQLHKIVGLSHISYHRWFHKL